MAKKPRLTKAKKDLLAIERGAKRAAQKSAGAFDGRFRERKMESAKRYTRKRKHPPRPKDEA